MVLAFLFPGFVDCGIASLEEAKTCREKVPPPDSDPFNGIESDENYAR
jgi:hypothetical protein